MHTRNEESEFTYYRPEAVAVWLDELASFNGDEPVMIGDMEPTECATVAEAIKQLERFRDGHRNNLFIHVGYHSGNSLRGWSKEFRRF